MKRKIALICLILVLTVLTACGNGKALEEAKTAVDSYNAVAEEFNANIQIYNDTVTAYNNQVDALQASLDKAQEVINKGEEPFDGSTLEALKNAMSEAGKAMLGKEEFIEPAEILTVSENAKSSELKALVQTANTGAEELANREVPGALDLPDYTETMAAIEDAQVVYEKSIQSLKQVTAPTDEFVMDRLQRVDTITAMAPVTEDHDPNRQLNKQGGYIGCIYFTDSQVDRSQLYIEEGEDNVIDVGNDGGGAVEIFATKEDAETRNSYIGTFDGNGLVKAGSHYVVGTCVVRTSDYLNGTQQKELTAKITEVLTSVD